MTFVEILQANGIKVVKGNGTGEIRICCLFCTDRGETVDTRFRLGINYINDLSQCWNCGFKSKRSKSVILKKINSPQDDVSTTEATTEEDVEAVQIPEGFEYISKSGGWQHKKALEYLRDRGFPFWQIKAKKLGVTIIGKFGYRIIFPVVFKKELVGIVGRDFTGTSKLKYLNSTGEKYIYNLPPTHKSVEQVVLSEGIFKALKIERVAMLPSAALLGHSLSDLQMSQLAYYSNLKKIVLWPDIDSVGIKGAVEICSKLADKGYKVYTIYPIPKAQADELPDKVVYRLLKEAIPYTETVAMKFKNEAVFL